MIEKAFTFVVDLLKILKVFIRVFDISGIHSLPNLFQVTHWSDPHIVYVRPSRTPLLRKSCPPSCVLFLH